MEVLEQTTPKADESFEAAFRAEFGAIHRYLYRRIGRDNADDLASQTFAIAYGRWHKFDHRAPCRPWLYGIAANLMLRHWRDEARKLRAYARSGVDPVVPPDEDATIDRLESQARRRELASALAGLKAADREILLLHAWAGLTDSEIATALSIPLGTVKSRLHRSREHLSRALNQHEVALTNEQEVLDDE